MKSLKKLLLVYLFAMLAIPCISQNRTTPKDVLATLQSAALNFNYAEVKEYVTERNVQYVDVAKAKLESPDAKFQKGLVSVALQSLQYEILGETVSNNGKSSTLKTKITVMNQPFTADIVFVVENSKWKIDNIPNAKDIPNQVPILQAFMK